MKYVLFVCTHNAGRSQMAQAFFERHAPDDIRAESAGQRPGREVWPAVVEAMKEVGIDPFRPTAHEAHRRDAASRRLGDHAGLRSDLSVRAYQGGGLGHPRSRRQADRGGPLDPRRRRVLRKGPPLSQRIDAIRSDRTAHQVRLARLLPDLSREFEGRRSEGEIRACADAILGDYDDVPVRSFVMNLAHRRSRECLAKAQCDALATA